MKYGTSEFYIEGGIVRWVSNGAVPPFDCLYEMREQGLITSNQLASSQVVGTRERDAFIEQYRERMKNYFPDEEEMFEMRSAFGKGATVVNVITGKSIKL